MDVRSSYDSAADAYAEHLFDELEGKPLDRHLLSRFAESVVTRGLVADLGCGPGHVAKYLHEAGVAVCGVDLSPEMIRYARHAVPNVGFRVGDMRVIDMQPASLAGIVAFYSIVHFAPTELRAIFGEWCRVLAPDGMLLLAFHEGDDTVHVDDLFGAPVSLDFRFHRAADVSRALCDAGFRVIETVQREPYGGGEYPSRRSYLLAVATERG